MTNQRLYKRIVRRETHSSRSLVTVITVVSISIVLIWVGAEIVLHLAALPPLIAAPHTLAEAVGGQIAYSSVQLGSVAAIGLSAGTLAVAAAISPGRRARHCRVNDRAAFVIDDATLASGVAARVARVAGVSRDMVRVTVGRRTVEAQVTPVTGVPVAEHLCEQALRAELIAAELAPSMRGNLSVRTQGRVGA
ncbi:hypothetical protein ACXR2W_08025 [Leucobacter sp. HY1908]